MSKSKFAPVYTYVRLAAHQTHYPARVYQNEAAYQNEM